MADHLDNFTSLDETCWQDGCGRRADYRCKVCEWPFCGKHTMKHGHAGLFAAPQGEREPATRDRGET